MRHQYIRFHWNSAGQGLPASVYYLLTPLTATSHGRLPKEVLHRNGLMLLSESKYYHYATSFQALEVSLSWVTLQYISQG
jgi:hypothetical protein